MTPFVPSIGEQPEPSGGLVCVFCFVFAENLFVNDRRCYYFFKNILFVEAELTAQASTTSVTDGAKPAAAAAAAEPEASVALPPYYESMRSAFDFAVNACRAGANQV